MDRASRVLAQPVTTSLSLAWSGLNKFLTLRPKLVLMGNRGYSSAMALGHTKPFEILESCFENNIILCRLPSHTSHKTKPCDVSVFGPLKTAYRDEVERRYRGGLRNVNKEHFTAIYSRAREREMTKKNILAGWAKTGLFPFNSLKVLRDIVKPDAPLTVQVSHNVESTQNGVIQTPEAVTQLLNLVKQDSHNNEPDEMRRQRLIQKLANAAERSIAQQAFDQNYIGFLKAANNEAKTRRSKIRYPEEAWEEWRRTGDETRRSRSNSGGPCRTC
jgi:hypothetical protein